MRIGDGGMKPLIHTINATVQILRPLEQPLSDDLPSPIRIPQSVNSFMFESETEQMAEQRRSRTLMVLGGIGALALAVVILLFAKGIRPTPTMVTNEQLPGGPQTRLDNAVRAGTPEFDAYKGKITLEDHDKLGSSNPLGMTQLILNARLTNRGDRTITGIELSLRAMSYAEPGKTVALNYSLPIPRKRSQLPPGESMSVTMKVDLPSKISEGEIGDIVPEVTGLRFQ